MYLFVHWKKALTKGWSPNSQKKDFTYIVSLKITYLCHPYKEVTLHVAYGTLVIHELLKSDALNDL